MNNLAIGINHKVREVIVNAFLGLPNKDAEILAIFHDKLYDLGQIIKQRDSELFEEIIRNYTDDMSREKIKIKTNRARRAK